ncbi:MAG: hypothetical protein DI598_12750 [Pseudopedobacter saltans]|uniref:Uncharacterized protein n=1 Tax=Pseudopedobacter saltans TaxID=151895 RepID=A0A2W5EP73_9SPHI|nr:MAG: hypothetical protein DI598_12750 [Pseudopedobacter saltans]
MLTKSLLANKIASIGSIENIAYMVHHYATTLIPRNTDFSKKDNGHGLMNDTILQLVLTEEGFGVLQIEDIRSLQKHLQNFPHELRNRQYYLLVNFDSRSDGRMFHFVEKTLKERFLLDCYAVLFKDCTKSVFVDFHTGTSSDARTVIRNFGFGFEKIHVEDADIAFVNNAFKTHFENLSFIEMADKIKRRPFKFYPDRNIETSPNPLEDEITPSTYICPKNGGIISLAAKIFFKQQSENTYNYE